MTPALEFLWAIIGVLLTIGGTFLEAFVTDPSWLWQQQNVEVHSLGVTYQIGAVLLVGCLGGKNAAAMSQIAYLALGLTVLPVFSEGGGLDYFKQPTFGYLLGFIPGGWICGFLAFKALPKLELLGFSCLCGLLTVHGMGIMYLTLSHLINGASTQGILLTEAFEKYSLQPLPGQLAVSCAVAVLSYILRGLMFY
ncbi:putative biotin transporter BioY [Planktothrix tepida]|uniref:Biotin transporter n=2 Tax=Planktothrix TaxID=54304 RepID=A0A1J1LHL7_9CYAN|nr:MULTISPECIES: biotin transporter BioY [Planktothrix]CAD5930071.1 putative biotin transporter BioY [Planktothrix tepida]CAD5979656.1 putative biotin transporter BioY [Planktothrix pseudagardhii]CUR31522.1 BioY protein [Planktothrix tepida PCC 9214]